MKKILSLFGAIGLIGIATSSSSFLVSCGHGKSSSDKHKNDIVVIDERALNEFIDEAKKFFLAPENKIQKMSSSSELKEKLTKMLSSDLSKELTISSIQKEDTKKNPKGVIVTLTVNQGYKVEHTNLLKFTISNIFK
ncbi:hypothetical protein [Spiroplasma endosymbiont of Crioceris asparagi]|uniref:hypothetical protein n=1 Tax=Spiroplasma endosymbiont of Crioceris asparagi TaxID=3066286 RepID=UPI0030CD3AB2